MRTHLAFLAALTAGPVLAGQPFPGGFIDTAGRTAYVAGTDGVDAIDLATGTARWRSKHGQRPLFLAGDQLFALSVSKGEFRIVGLDHASKGECSFRTKPAALPRWVAPNGRQAFAIEWRREGKLLLLSWSASTGGKLPQHARGRVRIDLSSGIVTELKEDGPAPPLATPKLLERRSVRWHRSIGGQLHAVTEEELPAPPGSRLHRLTLRAWDERTGREAKPRILLESTRPVVLPGEGGLHLWVRDAVTGEAPSPWLVYSGLDGQLVGRVPFIPGTKRAMLTGGKAYCLVSRSGPGLLDGNGERSYSLVAVHVGSGKTAWKWALSRHSVDVE